MFKYLLILLLLVYSVLSHDAKIHIYGSTDKIIPKEQSGAFVEFLLDYLNGPMGMWSQEFRDRGFDVEPNSTNISPDWKILEGSAKSIAGGYNENGQYYIELKNRDVIYQEIYYTDSTSLDIYFYAKSLQNDASIKVEIYGEDLNEILWESDDFNLNSDWNKYLFQTDILKGNKKLNIAFRSHGKTDLDEVSCMPSNNILGFRKEYYDMYKHWKPKVIRYPGGWFADTKGTSWRNAIGPIDKRKSPHQDRFGNPQRMDFGIQELYQFCQLIDAEIYYVVNYENGTPDEAADFVEYANSSIDSELVNLRKSHGQEEPYNIKYWEVGNEQWYDPVSYSLNYNEFYYKMVEKDPTIELLLPGNHWEGKDFLEKMLTHIDDKFDIWTYHPAGGIRSDDSESYENQFLVSVSIASQTEEYFDNCEKWLEEKGLGDKFQGSTEWWSTYGNDGDWLLDTNVRGASLESGLYNANMRHFYARKGKKMKMGARTVGIGLIRRRINSNGDRTIYGTGGYHALSMFNNHYGNKLMDYFIETEKYDHIVEDYSYQVNLDRLDAIVTESDDSIFVSMINRHLYEDAFVELNIDNIDLPANFMRYDLNSSHPLNANTPDDPKKIIEKTSLINASKNIIVPKHSYTIIAFAKETNSVDNFHETNYVNGRILHTQNLSGKKAFIYDISGRLVSKLIIKSDSESLNFLNTGIYFLNFENVENSKTIKFIIQE